MALQNTLQEKFKWLQENLRQKERLAVAFSGGVDSSFLLWAAHRVLGENAVGITVVGDMMSPEELAEAQAFAKQFGITQHTLAVDLFQLSGFWENSPERCYYCKRFLFGQMIEAANTMHMTLAEGSNVDDTADYRPGRRALQELHVSSPLLEAGLTKGEIRQLSHLYGLPVWNKPSCACLASRIPYGTAITPEMLSQVARAETFLHTLGLGQVRVRHHGEIARIETTAEEFPRVLEHREQIAAQCKQLGYAYVTVDLEPYRTGRLNDVLLEKNCQNLG